MRISRRSGGKPSLEHCIPLPSQLNQYSYHGCGFTMLKMFYTTKDLRKGLTNLTLTPLDHNPI